MPFFNSGLAHQRQYIPPGAAVAATISATGGTITTDGAYTVHTFTSSGDFVVTGSGNVETLVVAGGGGGGGNGGAGGGGAGGLRYDAAHAVTSTTYPITIGAGGAGGVAGVNNSFGANGSNSVFDSLTATGGGG